MATAVTLTSSRNGGRSAPARPLNHLAGVAGRADTPVIVVVPETNLLDWREDQALVVPLSGPL